MVFWIANFDYEKNNRPPSRVRKSIIQFIQSVRTYSEGNIKICRLDGATVPGGQKLGPMNARSKAILKMVDEDA